MIGISLLTLVPGAVGGTETYARGLTRALAEHGALAYRAFVPPVAPDAADGLPAELVGEYRAARSLPARALAMAAAAARPGPIRRRFARADALHYPLTIALPEPRAPFAITLHDVLHLDRPELFPRAERAFRTLAYDRSARRARLVIVPTGAVRERVVARLGIPAERIRVVHHGIDHERFRPARLERQPFLVYPARPWPHKNHARLLEAFSLVRRERPDARLVLTGGGHRRGTAPPGVYVPGLVSTSELVSLYRTAAGLVFPSLYEGFGAPPLEAMACGCPVAVSRIPPLQEVCGDAARYFDPTAVDELAAAMTELLDGRVAPRPEHAAAFTWAACARAHEAAYRELLSSARPRS